MINFKTIETKEKLKEVFDFMSRIFYDEAKEFNEHYYTMSERFNEMLEQFQKEKSLLLYIEEDGKIVASLTSKNMNAEKQKITLGVMAVAKSHRRKGYGKALVKEFEKRCTEKNIKHIDLGSRFSACPLYLSLNYKPSLMVQVFDFVTTKDVLKANTLNLEEYFNWQGETYGFVFFKVKEVKEEYIKHFDSKVPTAHTQFIFEKDLI